MGSEQELQAVRKAIDSHGSAVVLGHQHPDGDAIGSVLGLGLMLSRRGLKVSASWPEPFEIPEKYAFLPGTGMLKKPADIESEGLVFALDCANADRLEDMSARVMDAPDIVNIDHHPDNTMFGTVNIVDAAAAATAEIIYLAAPEIGLEIDTETAVCLYTGIVTDTGRFQFSNTSAETLRIAAGLVDRGVSPNHVFGSVYQSDSLEYMRLSGEILSRAVFEPDLGLIHASLTKADLERWGVRMAETEDLVDSLRSLKGHSMAVLFKETRDGRIRVSLRSRKDTDVGGIARKLGGGGHRAAAGYTSEKRSAAEALTELREEIVTGGWGSTGR